VDTTTTSALTQLGLSAIFAIACVQLFLRLEIKNNLFTGYLIETINAMRQQNTILMEQNKQISVALFANNADAQRAYAAMSRPRPSFSETPHDTNLDP